MISLRHRAHRSGMGRLGMLIGRFTLAIGLLGLIIGAGSFRWLAGVSHPPWYVIIERGELAVSLEKPAARGGENLGPLPININRWFTGRSYTGRLSPGEWIDENQQRWSMTSSGVRTWNIWILRRAYVTGGADYWVAKVWALALVPCAFGAVTVAIRYRANRRTAKGRCGACGYSLAGLTPGFPCPECGGPKAPA